MLSKFELQSKEFEKLQTYFNRDQNIYEFFDIQSEGKQQEKYIQMFELTDHKQKCPFKQFTVSNYRFILSNQKISQNKMKTHEIEFSQIPYDQIKSCSLESRIWEFFNTDDLGELKILFEKFDYQTRTEKYLLKIHQKNISNLSLDLKQFKFKFKVKVDDIFTNQLDHIISSYKQMIKNDVSKLQLSRQQKFKIEHYKTNELMKDFKKMKTENYDVKPRSFKHRKQSDVDMTKLLKKNSKESKICSLNSRKISDTTNQIQNNKSNKISKQASVLDYNKINQKDNKITDDTKLSQKDENKVSSDTVFNNIKTSFTDDLRDRKLAFEKLDNSFVNIKSVSDAKQNISKDITLISDRDDSKINDDSFLISKCGENDNQAKDNTFNKENVEFNENKHIGDNMQSSMDKKQILNKLDKNIGELKINLDKLFIPDYAKNNSNIKLNNKHIVKSISPNQMIKKEMNKTYFDYNKDLNFPKIKINQTNQNQDIDLNFSLGKIKCPNIIKYKNNSKNVFKHVFKIKKSNKTENDLCTERSKTAEIKLKNLQKHNNKISDDQRLEYCNLDPEQIKTQSTTQIDKKQYNFYKTDQLKIRRNVQFDKDIEKQIESAYVTQNIEDERSVN